MGRCEKKPTLVCPSQSLTQYASIDVNHMLFEPALFAFVESHTN